MLHRLREDIKNVQERDPAARGAIEIFFCYPGLHALWFWRFDHWLWKNNWKSTARFFSHLGRFFTGIEIHPGATIDKGLFIDHGMGVVIGETAEIGKNVTLYHGVTLGGTSLEKGKRHPTLEDDVVVGAGAKILGAIHVGRGSRIGANAVVVKDVPENSIVVGVPGQILSFAKKTQGLDFEHGKLPDAIGNALTEVILRIEKLENKEDLQPSHLIRPPKEGIWHGEDFVI